jgi:MSHA biogenesis protein MshJ
MKELWQRYATRIDALSLRQRVTIFGLATLVLVTLVNAVLLDAQFAKQAQLSQRLKQEQSQIAGIQAEIQQKLTRIELDPDAVDRARLKQVNQQLVQMHASLREMQKGLISPDKISAVLEDILKQNGSLRLVALKTLPVAGLTEADPVDSKIAADVAASGNPTGAKERSDGKAPVQTVFKHGVEITVQGGYLDMLNYLAALEAMPWHFFWGRAKMETAEYPKSTLTLTLFTLSLDKKWLNL